MYIYVSVSIYVLYMYVRMCAYVFLAYMSVKEVREARSQVLVYVYVCT